MPFVAVQKAARARRIRKARRKRPEWQDIIPADQEQRQAYKIAAKHEAKFARAYLDAVRDLAKSVNRSKLLEALRKRDQNTALGVVEWYDPAKLAPHWARMQRRFADAYSAVMEEAGKEEAKRVNAPRVRKQEPPLAFAFDLENPFTQQWIEEHAALRVAEVSAQAQLAVRSIVAEAFRFEEAPAKTARAIIDSGEIGLLEREAKAVANLEGRLRAAGVSEEIIEKRTGRYAQRLMRERAMRIARTETIQAEGAAIQQSWQTAKEQGFVTTQAFKEWIASTGSERTCPICIELDGQKVPVDQPWVSSIVGEVSSPGSAHVHCRCSAALVEPLDAMDVARFQQSTVMTETRRKKMERQRKKNRDLAAKRRKKRKRLTGIPKKKQ